MTRHLRTWCPNIHGNLEKQKESWRCPSPGLGNSEHGDGRIIHWTLLERGLYEQVSRLLNSSNDKPGLGHSESEPKRKEIGQEHLFYLGM